MKAMMMTNGCEHMTPDEFNTALRSKAPGSTFVYFTGYLAKVKGEVRNFEPQLTAVASMAISACARGEVLLTQKRLCEGKYEYRATIVRNPNQPRPLYSREKPRLAQPNWML